MNNILFVVDTSGSMYRNKISGVNAAIVECIGIIRKKIEEGQEINVFYSSFDEKMKPVSKVENIMENNLPEFETVESDGFYKLTRFSALYDGLLAYFDNKQYNYGDMYIVLVTDGRAVDSLKYGSKLNQIRSISDFRDAIKIVALVDSGVSPSQDLYEFADNKADRIFELSDLANELNSLLLVDSNEFNNDNSIYNTIFG